MYNVFVFILGNLSIHLFTPVFDKIGSDIEKHCILKERCWGFFLFVKLVVFTVNSLDHLLFTLN